MLLLTYQVVSLVTLFCCGAGAAPTELKPRDLSSFVALERAIAIQGVLNNIGPDGSKAPGAGPGYIIASPSRDDPPCKYSSHVKIESRLTDVRFLHMDSGLCIDHQDDYR